MTLIVTIDDVRKAGHCVTGARRWFAGRGFDFAAFVRDGLPAETLEETGDALALNVVAVARARNGNG